MQRIMQFTLNGIGTTELQVPVNSTVLKADSVVEAYEILKIWFLVPDDTAGTEVRTFRSISTDEEILGDLNSLNFISTCVDFGGVGGITQWHIFEVI